MKKIDLGKNSPHDKNKQKINTYIEKREMEEKKKPYSFHTAYL